jgi:hypothetical protein
MGRPCKTIAAPKSLILSKISRPDSSSLAPNRILCSLGNRHHLKNA